jgi:hypothetical protein
MVTLRVFCLTLKPHSYELHGVLDAGPDYLLGLYVQARCH